MSFKTSPKLTDPIISHFRLNEQQKSALKKLGRQTIADLIFHFPARYGDSADIKYITDLSDKNSAVIYGKIKNLKTGKTFRSHKPIASATVTDETGSLKIMWFSQPYIAKLFQNDMLVKLEGPISVSSNGKKTMINPKIEPAKTVPDHIGDSLFDENAPDLRLDPIYPESRGISSLWFFHAIQKILKSSLLDEIRDPLPETMLEKYHLPNLKTALVWIHSPRKQSDAESARKRFAFQEVLLLQIQQQIDRRVLQSEKAYIVNKNLRDMNNFVARFGFSLTDSQSSAVENILKDLSADKPMSRLLEGDVGSGKTAVAATISEAVIQTNPSGQSFGNLQVAYMVPTEILAKQHFENFIQYFKDSGVKIGLMTGSGCRKFPSKVNVESSTNISRAQLLKWVANGEIPILIGTHALIQKSVKFKHLALVIIDEQHRFGVSQRKQLARKEKYLPHLLSMTATPIPRTLALTLFGDLDLTVIDQMPLGRKPVITEIVLENEREATYQKIRAELNAGRQAYIICPRIDEPDPNLQNKLDVKSVTAEAKRLKEKIFPEFTIDLLHSKMKPSEKESVMKKFERGETKILVATSVVEVGVNVPNATVIVIEGADRFGLAQLHQLRGRVIRSNHQAYCFVFTDSRSDKTIERLRALKTARNGFELAEIDLQMRGVGELSGARQWGVSDLAMEAIRNLKMVELARAEAKEIVFENKLKDLPDLETEIKRRQTVHFE